MTFLKKGDFFPTFKKNHFLILKQFFLILHTNPPVSTPKKGDFKDTFNEISTSGYDGLTGTR